MGLPRSRLLLDESPPDAPGDDALLVAQAKGGDARAFGLLYRRHVEAVYDFAAHRLSHREDAEDATQTVWLRVALSIHHCRDEAAFRGWLFAIARNVVTDKLRTRRVPTMTLADGLEITDPAALPEELAVRGAQVGELRAARARCLDNPERELYDLLAQDLTYAEIATALDRRVNAVRTRYWRLLAKLRRCLGIRAKGAGRGAL